MADVECGYCHQKLQTVPTGERLFGRCEICRVGWTLFPLYPESVPTDPKKVFPRSHDAGSASCYIHPENAAESGCESCGRLVCTVCESPRFGKIYCSICWGLVRPETFYETVERLSYHTNDHKVSVRNLHIHYKTLFNTHKDERIYVDDFHFLLIEKMGSEEDYSRIAFRDIRYIALDIVGRKWRVGLVNSVAALVTLLAIVIALIFHRHMPETSEFVNYCLIIISVGIGSVFFFVQRAYRALRFNYTYAFVTDVQSIVFLTSSAYPYSAVYYSIKNITKPTNSVEPATSPSV